MKLRHIIIIVVFVTVNLLILGILFGSGPKAEETLKATSYVQNLKAVTFKPAPERFEIAGYGNVSSYNSLDVLSEAQGEISWGNLNLKPGAKFKKGQLLYTLNDRELRYAIRARKSSFINIIALALPDIKVDFSSEYDKWNNYLAEIKLNENLPTLPAWKTEKEKVFLSSRQILTEYFTIKGQEEQLRKYAFIAPFSGMISEVYVNEHSIANPGTRICKLVENLNFEIPVALPASSATKIKIGSKLSIAHSDGKIIGDGEIVRIADIINPNTQSITVYVKPSKTIQDKLVEGQYVKVIVPEEDIFTGMRVPYSAVKDGSVLIYNTKDSTLSRAEISVLHENEAGVFIAGLADNIIVISQEVITYSDSTKFGVIIE